MMDEGIKKELSLSNNFRDIDSIYSSFLQAIVYAAKFQSHYIP